MPNLRSKTWAEGDSYTPSDAQHMEDHLISDAQNDQITTNTADIATLKVGGGGHTIVDSAGTELAKENKLQFTGTGLTSVTDDSTNGKTVVTVSGEKGDAATVDVGTTTTGAAGTSASVTNSGTTSAAIFNFTIPAGATGPTGEKGDTGSKGDTGPAGPYTTIAVGTTSTLPAGSSATVTADTSITGTATLSFGIPKGADGSGTGDMLKSVYDTDNDGIVDNAEAVSGYTVARSVLADEYTNTQLDTLLTAKASASDLTAHISDISNPHSVTATQVGLGNVTNTSDADKPVSTAQATAIALKADQTSLDTTNATKADKSNSAVIVSIPVSAWSTSTNIASISVANVTATSNNEILPLLATSADNITNNDALQAAGLQDAGQSAGKITLYATSIPTVAISIRVIVRGDA